VDVLLGVCIGLGLAASAWAVLRLVSAPRRVLSPEGTAMQAALHAATATLPHLRRGLNAQSAGQAIGHLRALLQAPAVALTDRDAILAFDGVGAEHHHGGDDIAGLLATGRDERVHVETHLRCSEPLCPLRAAIVAPLVVDGERVGSLVALYTSGGRLRLEDTRVAQDAASLVAAQLELSVLEAQGERLARAELRALRAQISPHFVYNALAAVASYIHSRPEEARELLTDFAEFTRYAFRRERPHVHLADELTYVEKYLRLEHARFGDRLRVRLRSRRRSCRPWFRCCRCSRSWRTRCATAWSRARAPPTSRSSGATSAPTSSCACPTTGRGWTATRRARRWTARAAGSACPTCTAGCSRRSGRATAWRSSPPPGRARPSS
jgi:two-component system LytT family sensor kinase